MLKAVLFFGLAVLVFGTALNGTSFGPERAIAACPVTGSYQVQGNLTGDSGTMTLKVGGKFINGSGGCFASGTGSYSQKSSSGNGQGGLAVHTTWTSEWSNETALFLPSILKSGALAGEEVVIIACLKDGEFDIPGLFPNWGDAYAPNEVSTHECVERQILVWSVAFSYALSCEDCWVETEDPTFSGLGKVSLK